MAGPLSRRRRLETMSSSAIDARPELVGAGRDPSATRHADLEA